MASEATNLPNDVIEYLVAQSKTSAFGMVDHATAARLLAKYRPDLGIHHVSIRPDLEDMPLPKEANRV